SNEIVLEAPYNKVFKGHLTSISADPSELIPSSDIVLLCLPGYLIEETLNDISPYLQPSTIVGAIVSSTGFFFMAHKILPEKSKLFGFQRVPFISRVKAYGHSASLLGYKENLNVSMENIDDRDSFVNELSKAFITPINVLNNYYEVSLTNSNPILHTGRLFTMWKDKNSHQPVPQCIKFYSDWNNEASEILLEMDNEFGYLLEKVGVSRNVVPSLLEYYQCSNATSLTNKIRSIPAFKSIDAPMIQTQDGWIPDFKSRYFTEDFPFGLRYIWELAKNNQISTPTIDKVYKWGISMIG
ncbi:MAG: NAD/NADP octopine/nopaline dehydrogenase family protein, partial [Muribaculaceae bacterium]|nr:NAD/NADP octopine/nopaline dehydrogenase family protein [Muribaculaceae bacterium]